MPDEQHWRDNLLAALADLTVAIEALTAQLEASTRPSLRTRASQALDRMVHDHRPLFEPGLLGGEFDDLDPNDLVTTARGHTPRPKPGSSAPHQDPPKRREDDHGAAVLPLTRPRRPRRSKPPTPRDT